MWGIEEDKVDEKWTFLRPNKLSETFPSDESIMEIMNTNEPIWEDHHHRSSFLPNTSSVDHDFASLFSTDIVNTPQNPILLQDTNYEGKQISWDKINTYQTLPGKHAPRPNSETEKSEQFKDIECR